MTDLFQFVDGLFRKLERLWTSDPQPRILIFISVLNITSFPRSTSRVGSKGSPYPQLPVSF